MENKRKLDIKRRGKRQRTCTECRGLGLESVGVKISEASGIDAANMQQRKAGSGQQPQWGSCHCCC